MFRSLREMIAYYRACRRGPRGGRSDWSAGTKVQTSRKADTVWVQIGSLIYGHRSMGCMGIERDSDTDDALIDWATRPTAGKSRPRQVHRIYTQMRDLARELGLVSMPVIPVPTRPIETVSESGAPLKGRRTI